MTIRHSDDGGRQGNTGHQGDSGRCGPAGGARRLGDRPARSERHPYIVTALAYRPSSRASASSTVSRSSKTAVRRITSRIERTGGVTPARIILRPRLRAFLRTDTSAPTPLLSMNRTAERSITRSTSPVISETTACLTSAEFVLSRLSSPRSLKQRTLPHCSKVIRTRVWLAGGKSYMDRLLFIRYAVLWTRFALLVCRAGPGRLFSRAFRLRRDRDLEPRRSIRGLLAPSDGLQEDQELRTGRLSADDQFPSMTRDERRRQSFLGNRMPFDQHGFRRVPFSFDMKRDGLCLPVRGSDADQQLSPTGAAELLHETDREKAERGLEGPPVEQHPGSAPEPGHDPDGSALERPFQNA